MSRSLKRAFILIGVFFIALFIGIGFTLKLAFASHEPVTDERYYERGLDYQQRLDALSRGEANGWELDSSLFQDPEATTLAPGVTAVEWTLTNRRGEEIQNAEVRITLDRPATSAGRTTRVVRLADGERINASLYRFKTDLALPRAGYWDVTFEAKVNADAELSRTGRVFVR
jgi:nitrogen fixation protein FixH